MLKIFDIVYDRCRPLLFRKSWHIDRSQLDRSTKTFYDRSRTRNVCYGTGSTAEYSLQEKKFSMDVLLRPTIRINNIFCNAQPQLPSSVKLIIRFNKLDHCFCL